ncbi:MAG: type II toxin-antitoxin system RelE/ParE family toxin [Pyrinomonadaceae bacterium]
MVIIETSIFTRRVDELLTDDEYRLLQSELIHRPDLGKVIPGGGGLRKLRWALPGRGKSGGARTIYYWVVDRNTILMLYAYAENELSDLTPKQVETLRKVVEEEFK